jgi:hypothetical protein
MSDRVKNEMLGYYAYSYLSLNEKNYKGAVSGFNYTLRKNIEVEKSAIGLVCAHSCLGHYKKALRVYDSYKESIIFNARLRHQLVKDLSYFLCRDTSAMKLQRQNYFSSIMLNRAMQKTHSIYVDDPSNIVAIILLSYWHIFTGHVFEDMKAIADVCVFFRTLDDAFRWKLLNRVAIENTDLWEDETLAGMFTEIPEEVSNNEYINTLILSMMYSSDLEKARDNIEIYRNKGYVFTNEVMWNFIRLSVEEDEIDDLSVNFAKHLISDGWADSYIAEVIRFGYANRSRYSVKKELNRLAYLNL